MAELPSMKFEIVETDQLDRIERKLDQLIAALAGEQGDEDLTSLDGKTFAARDDRRSLG